MTNHLPASDPGKLYMEAGLYETSKPLRLRRRARLLCIVVAAAAAWGPILALVWWAI